MPLISVLRHQATGRAEDGKVSVGALPAFAVTVGRVPPPLDTCVPVVPAVLEYAFEHVDDEHQRGGAGDAELGLPDVP